MVICECGVYRFLIKEQSTASPPCIPSLYRSTVYCYSISSALGPVIPAPRGLCQIFILVGYSEVHSREKAKSCHHDRTMILNFELQGTLQDQRSPLERERAQ
jgi:hypothetical protein